MSDRKYVGVQLQIGNTNCTFKLWIAIDLQTRQIAPLSLLEESSCRHKVVVPKHTWGFQKGEIKDVKSFTTLSGTKHRDEAAFKFCPQNLHSWCSLQREPNKLIYSRQMKNNPLSINIFTTLSPRAGEGDIAEKPIKTRGERPNENVHEK